MIAEALLLGLMGGLSSCFLVVFTRSRWNEGGDE